MAQFIQSNQLTPVQGSAGQQQVVQNQGPTLGEGLASVLKNTGSLLDVAGDVYSENQAKSIVNEEIQNLDKARSIAEKGKFTAGDPVPESIKLDQKQWDMLATAVQSGALSQDKARLIASSRLRTRIAEEPFFADRMRKAASGVLGFNIESEAAQQYFTSLPTEAQLNSTSAKSQYAKYADQAQAWKSAGVIENVDEGIQWLAKADMLETQNKVAEVQAEAGIRNANDVANTLIQNHNAVAWSTFLGDMKAEEAQTGQPIKPEEFTRKLDNQRVLFKQRFDNAWVKSGGDLNTPEYNRQLDALNQQYADMKEFANTYGIDNVLKLNVERQNRLFEAAGQQMFPQLTLITKTFGQQTASDLINLAATNSTKRDLLMKQNPELAAAFNLMNQDPKLFNNKLMQVGSKVIRGENLSDEDPALVDYTVKALHDSGSQETKATTIQTLADQGYNWKSLSVLADSRAYLEPEVNKEYFKTQYNQGLPAAVNQLALELQATPGISAEVNDSGDVVVVTDVAGGAGMPQTGTGGLITNPQETQAQIVAVNRAKSLADKINLFNKAMGRGYSQVVGTTKDQYKVDLKKKLNDSINNIKTQQTNQMQTDFNSQVANGDLETAQSTYEKMRQQNPDLYNLTWEQVVQEATRRAQQGGQ